MILECFTSKSCKIKRSLPTSRCECSAVVWKHSCGWWRRLSWRVTGRDKTGGGGFKARLVVKTISWRLIGHGWMTSRFSLSLLQTLPTLTHTRTHTHTCMHIHTWTFHWLPGGVICPTLIWLPDDVYFRYDVMILPHWNNIIVLSRWKEAVLTWIQSEQTPSSRHLYQLNKFKH